MPEINIKKSIFCISLVSVLLISQNAQTQENSLWQDMGLYGGQINDIAIDPDNPLIIYAGSWNGDGMFKSTDGGATWKTIPESDSSWFRNRSVDDIEIDPSNHNTIWVAHDYYLDVSYDAGNTWQTFYFASDEDRYCNSVAVDPFDSNTIYVGTGGPKGSDKYGAIFITNNGGQSWHKQTFDTSSYTPEIMHEFCKIKFNPNKQGEIWLVNSRYYESLIAFVSVSSDYGNTWQSWTSAWRNDNETSFGHVNDLLIHPTDPQKIYLGTWNSIAYKFDGSKPDTQWSKTTVDITCRALCIPPTEPDTIYGGLSALVAEGRDLFVFIEKIAKSTDGGLTWNTTLPPPTAFITMKAHPTDNTTLFGGSMNLGIFKTADKAQSWMKINNGIRANTIFDTALDPTNPSRILCATLAGVYLTDNGTTWKMINKLASEAVAFNSTNPDTIYAGFDWSIGKSTDGGSTWSYLATPYPVYANIVVSIAVAPAGGTAATVYAAVAFASGRKGAILKIQDSGGDLATAHMSAVLQTRVSVNAVAMSPADPSLVIVATGNFYAPGGPGGIYVSRDGGDSWKKIFLLDRVVANCIAFAPSEPDVIFVGCGDSVGDYDGLLKSTDRGKTWKSKRAGLPQHFSVRDIKVSSDDSNTVIAALYTGYDDVNHNLGGTYISTDGGEYWTCVGLSNYKMHDISIPKTSSGSFSVKSNAAQSADVKIPTCNVYAGTASGLYSYSFDAAGTGVIHGFVRAADTNALIDGAEVSLPCGVGALTYQGHYVMLAPAGSYNAMVLAPGYVQASMPQVTVGAGSSIELEDIIMEPVNDNCSTCICKEMVQDAPDAPLLQELRRFRDSTLRKTPVGNRIISQYYSLGKELLPVLRGNPGLRAQCVKLIGQAAKVGHDATVKKRLSLPVGFMDSISSFLMALEKESPPELRAKIQKARCDMRKITIESLQPVR